MLRCRHHTNSWHETDRFTHPARPSTVAILVALIAYGGGAGAQDAGEEPVDLGTLILSGQKFDRSLQDTDASVSVVVPGEGVAAGADDILGLTERLANVELFAGDLGFAIRGIGQTGFGFGQTNFQLTRSPNDLVATYIDGIPVSVYAAPFSFWDIDQIEVLRGAQSTLLGRGSLGGAVVLESADPTFANEGAARVTFGTEGERGLSIAYGGPLIEDRLAYRIALDADEAPSFNDNITTGKDGDIHEILSGRLKLLYQGENGSELEFSVFRSQTEVGTRFVDVRFWPDDRVLRSDVDDRLENDAFGASLRGSWGLADTLSFESVTVWVEEDADRVLDIDTTQLPIASAALTDEIRTASQELRLRYTTSQFEGFVGLYYEDFKGDSIVDSGAFGVRRISQEVQTAALFGEGVWSVSNRFDLTIGLRAENETTDVTSDNGFVVTRSDDDSFVLLPKLGISYDLTPETRIYLTAHRGYRAGGAGASVVTGQTFAFDPEFTTNIDLGLRRQSSDGRLTLGANLFYVEWRGQQLAIPAASGLPGDTIISNVGESESYGLELDAALQATENLQLFASLGLLQTEIKEADASNSALIGNDFTFAPETVLSIGAAHDFGNGLDMSIAANWRSSFYSDALNSAVDQVGSRTLVDLGVGYEISDLARLDLKVTNLFDEQYEKLSATLNADAFGFDTDGGVAPGEGRAISLTLSARF